MAEMNAKVKFGSDCNHHFVYMRVTVRADHRTESMRRLVTTLGGLAPGSRVNLEIDLIARYLARWNETA